MGPQLRGSMTSSSTWSRTRTRPGPGAGPLSPGLVPHTVQEQVLLVPDSYHTRSRSRFSSSRTRTRPGPGAGPLSPGLSVESGTVLRDPRHSSPDDVTAANWRRRTGECSGSHETGTRTTEPHLMSSTVVVVIIIIIIIFLYTCICIYICVGFIWTHIYIYTYICIYMCICVYMYIYVYILGLSID